MYKAHLVGGGWAALLGADISIAHRLISLYRKHFAAQHENIVIMESAYEALTVPARELRAQLAEDLIQKKFCKSHDWFLEYGMAQLPDDVYRQALYEIEHRDLEGAEFLLHKAQHASVVAVESGKQNGSEYRL